MLFVYLSIIILLSPTFCSLIYSTNADVIPRCPCNQKYYQDIFQKIAKIERTYNGSGNNQQHPLWGAKQRPLIRIAPAVNSKFCQESVESKPPSARLISNLVCSLQGKKLENDPRNLSAIFLVWGQFLSHDLDHTPPQEGPNKEECDIQIPKGDKFFDPQNIGNKTLAFVRSVYEPHKPHQPRQQLNLLNSWFDGEAIYGSDKQSADNFRVFQDGKMKLSPQKLLTKINNTVFVSGDTRVNQNIVLTAINTIFVRQHNRVCDYFKTQNKIYGKYTDQQKYIFAKNYVSALIAKITYYDYLPLLLGKENNLAPYQGYDKDIDPSITNVFATAAFRHGHFTVPEFILKIDNNDVQIQKIRVRDGVKNPSIIKTNEDIGQILKGQSKNVIKKRNAQVSDQMRNFLVTTPNRSFLLDLASLNIQRGRDHSLPDYNTFRRYLGLKQMKNFSQLSSDETIMKKLTQCYESINQVDIFIGLMVEQSLPGAQIGELGSAIIRHTMARVRAGDRFWYQRAFPKQIVESIQSTTLSDIIKRNTQIRGLSDEVFIVS